MRYKLGLQKIIDKLNKVKALFARIYRKNKLLGIILVCVWFGAMLIIVPILWFMGGWALVISYLICKFSGICPL